MSNTVVIIVPYFQQSCVYTLQIIIQKNPYIVILQRRHRGKIVLCDRFSDSTLVYQGFVRGLPLQELLQLNTFATGGLEPDLTLLLDGDPLLLAGRRSQRGVTDRFENEGLAFQLKVRQGFVELSKAYPQRIRVIDALQEQESVRGCLISELEALLKE